MAQRHEPSTSHLVLWRRCAMLLLATAPCISTSSTLTYRYTFDNSSFLVYDPNQTLPDLPQGTRTEIYYSQFFSHQIGVIVLGGPSSFEGPQRHFAGIIRRSLKIFADYVNLERQGVRVGGDHYAIALSFVGDHSNQSESALAMAHALRGDDVRPRADFAIGGYSAELTFASSLQASVEGRLMISAGASHEDIFNDAARSPPLQGDLSFGFLPSNQLYWDAATQLILQAASDIDDGQIVLAASMESLCVPGRCRDTLHFGQPVPEDAVPTRLEAEGVPESVARYKKGDVASLRRALETLRASGVTVLLAFQVVDVHEAMAMLHALEQIEWSPLAVVLHGAYLVNDLWSERVLMGWRGGTHVLGMVPWYDQRLERGACSGMTSDQFATNYQLRQGHLPSYHGAAAFAAGCALVTAIEAADSLESARVAEQLRRIDLQEFYAHMTFNQSQQLSHRMIMIQQPSGTGSLEIVGAPGDQVASINTTVTFPRPSWAHIDCMLDTDQCSGHGTCSQAGKCVCEVDGLGFLLWDGPKCNLRPVPAWVDAMLYSVIGVVACAASIAICICVRVARRRYRAAQLALATYREGLAAKLDEALATCSDIPHSCAMIAANDFVALGELRSHEELRDRGLLVHHDKLTELTRAPARIIFFSHQWTANSEPDWCGTQYATMVAAIDRVVAAKAWQRCHVWIWVDYISIPQASRGQQKLAISSLVGYASVAHAFVIAAPPVEHKDSGRLCNVETYNKRMWCRAENLAHSLRNGTDHMWVATGRTPEQCHPQADDLDFLNSNLHVFQGEATVEADKLSLVPAMLGLYAELYAIALHIYEHGYEGRGADGSMDMGELLWEGSYSSKTRARPEREKSRASIVRRLRRHTSLLRKAVSNEDDDNIPSELSADFKPSSNPYVVSQARKFGSIAHLVAYVKASDMSSRLPVLGLIHESMKTIFPRTVVIHPPPWEAEKPAAEHELFGPLVPMMCERLQQDAGLCARLVEQALSRKIAASESNLIAVARLAKRWRNKALAPIGQKELLRSMSSPAAAMTPAVAAIAPAASTALAPAASSRFNMSSLMPFAPAASSLAPSTANSQPIPEEVDGSSDDEDADEDAAFAQLAQLQSRDDNRRRTLTSVPTLRSIGSISSSAEIRTARGPTTLTVAQQWLKTEERHDVEAVSADPEDSRAKGAFEL